MMHSQSVNDVCSGAIDLTVGTTCVNTLVTITVDETDSGVPDPECAEYIGGDLWYKLTMPATGGVHIETDVDDGSITDGGMAIYLGADCDNLYRIDCDDDGNDDSAEAFEHVDLTLPEGTIVYIRVWEYNGTGPGTFNICAYEFTPLPEPANNECIDAIDLVVALACSPIIGTNSGATDSEILNPTIPDPGCAEYQGDDIWFKLIVPPSGDLGVETYEDDLSITDGGMAIYSGGCDPNGLTLIECDDDSGDITDENFELIELLDQTPGETLYVRIWSYDDDEVGTFNICAVELNPLSVEEDSIITFSMYPNPAKDELYINLSDVSENTLISVYDVQGKIIMIFESRNQPSINLDISAFARGLYFVKVIKGERELVKKLIVQ